jgi:ADP-heptose:LPS heptosyltransferase
MTTPLVWDDTIKRVLIVKLRSLGDIVLSTPCLELLKRWRPDLEIDFVAETDNHAVVDHNPHLHDVIAMPAKNDFPSTLARLRMALALRKRKYDLVINLHGGTTAILFAWCVGGSKNAVRAKRRLAFLANLQAPEPDVIWGRDEAWMHNTEYQAAMLKWLGVPVDRVPPTCLVVDPEAKARVQARLAALGVTEFVVMHPGGAAANKLWEPARFSRIVEHLHARHGLTTLVTSAGHERAITEAVVAGAACPAHALTDLSLAEAIALFSLARLFVGNDSGPAHLAAACRVPVLVLFGPTDWRKWGPWTLAPHKVIFARDPEFDYTTVDDPGTHIYFGDINAITVDEVRDGLDALLAEMAAAR